MISSWRRYNHYRSSLRNSLLVPQVRLIARKQMYATSKHADFECYFETLNTFKKLNVTTCYFLPEYFLMKAIVMKASRILRFSEVVNRRICKRAIPQWTTLRVTKWRAHVRPRHILGEASPCVPGAPHVPHSAIDISISIVPTNLAAEGSADREFRIGEYR